jgi:hypothetical protein
MGGTVPLGYRVESRKLLIVEEEAETVRLIFRRYLELGSLPACRTICASVVSSPAGDRSHREDQGRGAVHHRTSASASHQPDLSG